MYVCMYVYIYIYAHIRRGPAFAVQETCSHVADVRHWANADTAVPDILVVHPVSVRRFPSFRTQPLENIAPLPLNKWVPEQPSPWRKYSKRESCYGDRVYFKHSRIVAKVGGVNNYDIALGWQGACRYPMNTTSSNMARESPTPTPNFQKDISKKLADAGSSFQQSDGLLQMLGAGAQLELGVPSHVCVCVCVYTHIHTYMHIYIYTHTYIHVCVYTYVYIYIYIYTAPRAASRQPSDLPSSLVLLLQTSLEISRDLRHPVIYESCTLVIC